MLNTTVKRSTPHRITATSGRIVGNWKILVRYALGLAHIALYALTFALSATFIFSVLLCVLMTLWAIPVIVYMPAMLVLNLLRRRSSFDSAGGEVGYLVVEAPMFLAMSIITTYDASSIPCDKILDLSGTLNPYNKDTCDKVTLIAILLWVHTALLVGWMAWIIREVWQVGGLPRRRVFGMSTQSLLRGEYNIEPSRTDRGVLELIGPSGALELREAHGEGAASPGGNRYLQEAHLDRRTSLEEEPLPAYSKDPKDSRLGGSSGA